MTFPKSQKNQLRKGCHPFMLLNELMKSDDGTVNKHMLLRKFASSKSVFRSVLRDMEVRGLITLNDVRITPAGKEAFKNAM